MAHTCSQLHQLFFWISPQLNLQYFVQESSIITSVLSYRETRLFIFFSAKLFLNHTSAFPKKKTAEFSSRFFDCRGGVAHITYSQVSIQSSDRRKRSFKTSQVQLVFGVCTERFTISFRITDFICCYSTNEINLSSLLIHFGIRRVTWQSSKRCPMVATLQNTQVICDNRNDENDEE